MYYIKDQTAVPSCSCSWPTSPRQPSLQPPLPPSCYSSSSGFYFPLSFLTVLQFCSYISKKCTYPPRILPFSTPISFIPIFIPSPLSSYSSSSSFSCSSLLLLPLCRLPNPPAIHRFPLVLSSSYPFCSFSSSPPLPFLPFLISKSISFLLFLLFLLSLFLLPSLTAPPTLPFHHHRHPTRKDSK